MSEKLQKILTELGETINQEIIDAPAPALDITDRSISGNKINGSVTTTDSSSDNKCSQERKQSTYKQYIFRSGSLLNRKEMRMLQLSQSLSKMLVFIHVYVFLAIYLSFPFPTLACTNILVTNMASQDGTALIGDNDDTG